MLVPRQTGNLIRNYVSRVKVTGSVEIKGIRRVLRFARLRSFRSALTSLMSGAMGPPREHVTLLFVFPFALRALSAVIVFFWM